VIVLNSSPVIHLSAALGGLALVTELYRRVLVPVEVLRELQSGAHLDDTAVSIQSVSGIEIVPVGAGISPLLTGELDLGEAAVIQLALERPGATVVLDDLKARRVARRSGIPLTGSLGVLLHAKRMGRLDSVGDAVGCIRRHGAWLSDAVVERAMRLAGERD